MLPCNYTLATNYDYCEVCALEDWKLSPLYEEPKPKIIEPKEPSWFIK